MKATRQSKQKNLSKTPLAMARTKEQPALKNQELAPTSNEHTETQTFPVSNGKVEVPVETISNRPTSPPNMRPMYIDQQDELRVALARRAAKQATIAKKDDDEIVVDK